MGKIITAPVIVIPNGNANCFVASTLLIKKHDTKITVKNVCKLDVFLSLFIEIILLVKF